MFSKIGTLRCFLGIRTRKGLHFRARTVRQLPGIPYAVEDETVTEQLGDVRADDDRWLPLGDSTEGVGPGFRCSLADDDSCAGVLLTQDRSKKRPKPDGFGGRGDGGVGERLAAGIS